MKMTDCDSSMISAHGHDPNTNTLRLRFKSDGSEHDYANFTSDHYEALQSGSVGKFFHQNLRGNDKHPCSKVCD